MSLVNDLRQMVAAGRAEYTVADDQYWSDAHLQAALDNHRRLVDVQLLAWHSQKIGGSVVYKRAALNVGMAIEPNAGTVADSNGNAASGWTISRDGWVDFTADAAGTAYYYTGWAYDLNAAASEVCDAWASSLKGLVDVTSDDQSLKLSQKVATLKDLARSFAAKGSVKQGALTRGDALR